MESRKQDKNLNRYRLHQVRSSYFREVSGMEFEQVSEIFNTFKCSSYYDFVGYIDAVDLDHAYQMTNSIETLWTENIPADMLMINFRAGCRSTSVGDVFVDCETGKAWHVSSFGFTEMAV